MFLYGYDSAERKHKGCKAKYDVFRCIYACESVTIIENLLSVYC